MTEKRIAVQNAEGLLGEGEVGLAPSLFSYSRSEEFHDESNTIFKYVKPKIHRKTAREQQMGQQYAPDDIDQAMLQSQPSSCASYYTQQDQYMRVYPSRPEAHQQQFIPQYRPVKQHQAHALQQSIRPFSPAEARTQMWSPKQSFQTGYFDDDCRQPQQHDHLNGRGYAGVEDGSYYSQYAQGGADQSLSDLYLSDSDSTGSRFSQQNLQPPHQRAGIHRDGGFGGVLPFSKIEEEPVTFSSDSSLTNSEQLSSDSYNRIAPLMSRNENQMYKKELAWGALSNPALCDDPPLSKSGMSSDSSLTNSEHVSVDQGNESNGNVLNKLFGSSAPSLFDTDLVNQSDGLHQAVEPPQVASEEASGDKSPLHIDTVLESALTNLGLDGDYSPSPTRRLSSRRGSKGSVESGSGNSISSLKKASRRGSNSSSGSSGSRNSDCPMVTANIVTTHRSPNSSPRVSRGLMQRKTSASLYF